MINVKARLVKIPRNTIALQLGQVTVTTVISINSDAA
jgi:hypothetical protein